MRSDVVNWTTRAQDRNEWRIMNTIIEFQFTHSDVNFFDQLSDYIRRALPHEVRVREKEKEK